MNGSGHGVAELDLFIANTVSADDGATGLDHLRQAAGKHLFEHLDLTALGEAHQREGADRLAAIAYTSLNALVAAIWPKTCGSSTMGVKKSTVCTNASSGVS